MNGPSLPDAANPGDDSELPRVLPDDAHSSAGEQAASESQQLLIAELRRLASLALRRERKDSLLQTTVIVHEVWIRLQGQLHLETTNRVQFLAMAAVAIRRVLVDYVRRELAEKRGGRRMVRLPIDAPGLELVDPRDHSTSPLDLLALDEALEKLSFHRARCGEVVQLRFFAGLSNREIAEHLQLSVRTVNNDWQYAKAWLFRQLGPTGSEDESPPSK